MNIYTVECDSINPVPDFDPIVGRPVISIRLAYDAADLYMRSHGGRTAWKVQYPDASEVIGMWTTELYRLVILCISIIEDHQEMEEVFSAWKGRMP